MIKFDKVGKHLLLSIAVSTANVSSQSTLATDQEEKQPPPQRSTATSRSSPPLVSTAQSRAEQNSLVSVRQQVEEKKQSAVRIHSDASDRKVGTMTMSTVLRDDEIADLKRFHDNSLAATTRKAYESDYQSFLHFLEKRFPNMSENQIHTQCTLEHGGARASAATVGKRATAHGPCLS